jgi:YD repeat-containing protein
MSIKEALKRAFLFALILMSPILSIPHFAAASNTTYTYDGAGRLIRVDYGDGKIMEYTYDNAGNLLRSGVETYTLTVTRSGAGSGTITSSPSGIDCGSDCGETYDQGTNVTLTATPAAGSTFAGWSGDGCSGTGNCQVAVNSDTTITATFNLIQYTLTVNRTGTGSGTVASSPSGIDCGSDCSETYNEGTSVTLTATPGSGSTFGGWTGDPDCSDGVVTMNANKTCTATFNAQVVGYTLTVTKAGTGSGAVASSPSGIDCGSDCGETYNQGTNVTLTATPAAGSTFGGWTGEPDCSDGVVTMNANKTCTAAFNPQGSGYTLTVTKSGTGSGTITSSPSGVDCGSACSAGFKSGASVTLKVKADAGSTFTGWSGACTGASCKVKIVSNLTVTATFVLPDLRGEWSGVSVKQNRTNYEISGKLTVFSDDGKAASVSAKVYLSDDDNYDASDTLLGSVSIGTINANSSKAKALKYKVTANPSSKYLIAVIDPDGKVPESNENNNVAGNQVP